MAIFIWALATVSVAHAMYIPRILCRNTCQFTNTLPGPIYSNFFGLNICSSSSVVCHSMPLCDCTCSPILPTLSWPCLPFYHLGGAYLPLNLSSNLFTSGRLLLKWYVIKYPFSVFLKFPPLLLSQPYTVQYQFIYLLDCKQCAVGLEV